MNIFNIGDLVTTKKENDKIILVILEIDDGKFFLNKKLAAADPIITCKCIRTQKDYIFDQSYIKHII